MAFVKSGWLLRQSTILKRWKKNWFDLWSDGHLIYYDAQTRQSVEDKVHMPVDCINIRMGRECRDIQPPDGKPKDCMLQIVCRDGKTISLCAESTDDCLAWKFTLQDSRTNTAYVGSEVMYDETAVASSPPPYTAYAAPTPETVILYGEGDGTPLQYSCLENPMDGGAWWAAVHGVAEGRTRLSDFTFTFQFHAMEKEMATHSSDLA